MNLDVLLDKDIDLPRLSEVLDGLGHVGRLDTIRHWSGDVQARLFEATKGFRTLTLDDFVTPGVEPLVEVIHHGKNSLPAFTHFQKRFCKPKAAEEGAEAPNELWGYNEQTFGTFTGPGYFVTHLPEGRDDGAAGEIDIDYRKIPPGKVDSWPPILSNEARLGSLVYAGMVDVMRGIKRLFDPDNLMNPGKLIAG